MLCYLLGEGLQFWVMDYDWVGSFQFLSGNVAALLVLATAVFILLIPDVRLALVGLTLQYFALMLLYLDVIDPRLALVKLLVGWFVCLILLVTGRQVHWGRDKRTKSVKFGERKVSVTAVRGVLALVMLGIVWLLAQQDLPFLPMLPDAAMNLAVYGLVGFGLLGVLTAADDLLRAGMGVLMFLAGLELYTTSRFDQSLAGLAMLAAVNLIVVLVVALLAQKRYTAATKYLNQGF